MSSREANRKSKKLLPFLKRLLHCFSIRVEITGNNRYCFILKRAGNCKEKFQMVKKVIRNLNFNKLNICKDTYDVISVIQII